MPPPRPSRAAAARGRGRGFSSAAALAVLLAAALIAAPRAAADRLGSCKNIDSVCQANVDAVAGNYSTVWPGPGSILEGLLECAPSGDTCGDWPLYHAVADPGRRGVVL
jgi:hypothetical protein